MSAANDTFGNMTLHAGPDAWVRCGTYTNGPLPNLSVRRSAAGPGATSLPGVAVAAALGAVEWHINGTKALARMGEGGVLPGEVFTFGAELGGCGMIVAAPTG